MAIVYNGNRIIPTPFLSITKSYNESPDTTHVGSLFNIKLEGKFLYNMGSPSSSGTFWNIAGYPPAENLPDSTQWMRSIISKQEAIRGLFAKEGQQFYVEDWGGGSGCLLCNPRVKSIEFPRGQGPSWFNQGEYTVNLEADRIYLGQPSSSGYAYQLYDYYPIESDESTVTNFNIESASEEWDLEVQNEDLQLFRLSHNISAKGKRFYNPSGVLVQQAWQNASGYVLTKLGLDTSVMFASGVLNLIGVSGYNYWRNQKIGELDGTFAVTETFLCFNAQSGWAAYETWDSNQRISMEGIVNVTLKGEVQGLEIRDYLTRQLQCTKYQNASGYFNTLVGNSTFFHRAQSIIGGSFPLNPTALNVTTTINPVTGNIGYSYEYDNRVAPGIAGALSEIITVSLDYPCDVFAELCVLGRAAGPVLQSIQTVTSQHKTIGVEAVMPVATYGTPTSTKPDTNSLISGYVPLTTQVYKSRDTENWNPYKGTYSRQVTWTYSN